MAINCDTHEFRIPQKEVKLVSDLQKWADSEAYQDIMGFLLAVNGAVRGEKSPPATSGGVTLLKLVAMLDTMSSWADRIAPVEQPQRFGNKAFRAFFQRLEQEAEALLRDALPPSLHRAVPELAIYLTESVGNPTRIDYGTGHELAFVMLLCALFKVQALKEADLRDTGLVLFDRYLRLVRHLQQRYRMEPAGSQGVWSLDDYQFVCFIWGSSQLIAHPRVQPKAIANAEMVDALAAEFMLFSCIQYILQVKTGPFAEHSNQLWNISAVPHWGKVNSGLLKMYRGEVLSKQPVIQHCRFGSVLSIAPAVQKQHELVISAPPTAAAAGGGGHVLATLPGRGGMSMARIPPPVTRRPPPPAVSVGRMPPSAEVGRMPPPAEAPVGRMPPSAEVGRMPPPAEAPVGRMPPSAEAPVGRMPPSAEVGRMLPPAEAPVGRMPPPAEAPVGRMPPPAALSVGRMPPSAEVGRMPPSAEVGRMPPSAEAMRMPPAEAGRMPPAEAPVGRMPPPGSLPMG